MANQTLDQIESKHNNSHSETSEIEHFFGQSNPAEPTTASEERRQALHTIVNLAIFILLWVGSSVAALMTDYTRYVKIALVLIAFPVWGYFINRFVIDWTSPIAGPKQPS